jgi:hypothetical protein
MGLVSLRWLAVSGLRQALEACCRPWMVAMAVVRRSGRRRHDMATTMLLRPGPKRSGEMQ